MVVRRFRGGWRRFRGGWRRFRGGQWWCIFLWRVLLFF